MVMYKKIFMGIAAVAALTLVSCSSDDLNSLSDNSSKNEAISFDGYLGRSAVAVNGSRGSELTKDALQKSTEGFGVFGNYSEKTETLYGNNLFENEQVTYDKSTTPAKWTYTNTIGQQKVILISWRMLLMEEPQTLMVLLLILL